MRSLLVAGVLALAIPDALQEPPANQVAGPEQAFRARLDEAEVLLKRNADAQALRLLETLLPEAVALGEPALLMEAHHHLGWAYRYLNDNPRSLDHYGQALALSRSLASPRFEARALYGMAMARKNQGDHAQALAQAVEAVRLFETLGDRLDAGQAWRTVGAVRDQMGDHRAALDAYQEARIRLEGTDDPAFFRLLGDLGITYKNLGDYEQALATYAAAMQGARRLGDRHLQAQTHNNLGIAYKVLGQDERAIEHYERGLALSRELGERRGESFLLGNLADAWNARGDHERALHYLDQQLSLARAIGSRLIEAVALKGQGDVLSALREWSQARERYEQALVIQREIAARAQAGTTLAALAEVNRRDGRLADSRMQAEEALALGQETARPELELEARLVLARVARAGGAAEGALRHLRAGVGIIDSVRGRVLTDVGKVAYLDARQAMYHDLVDLLAGQGRAAEALETAEAARSRAFSDLLAGRQIALKGTEATPLAAIREAEARLRAQGRAVPRDESARVQLAQTRGATEADLDARLRSLQAEQRELASLVVAEPMLLPEIVATARRLPATIVEYLVTEERLFIWVVSPAGAVQSATADVGRDRLREKVRDLHRKLDNVDLAALREPRSTLESLAELYGWTLAPVASHLPRDPDALVYLIPHDALFLVPFAALVDERGRHLAEKHTLASAPSIGVLRYTAKKKQRVVSAQRPHLLAIADPRPPEGAGLGALPGARAEVRRISRGFPALRQTLLLAEQASEANVKRLGPGQTILHFAVHGLVHDGRPLDSALVLAAGAGEDGWLKASEAFGLDLRADLVVLSGCSTGLGKVTGDGILGLARAFLYAGTPTVVVSQWDVSDVATAFLMDRFYAGLRSGRGKARSLRDAQLAAFRRYRHPALWAAFSLAGEP